MKSMMLVIALMGLVGLHDAEARGRGGGGGRSGGGHSGGGHYKGGSGSSHKSGKYKNPETNDHYRKRS